MSLPKSEHQPDDPDRLPPARRRRARRLLVPMEADERAAFIDDVAHRASPSFDFFLFTLLSGIVLGAGLLLNSTPLLVLGSIVAPFLAPAMGISLGTILGSVRYFLRSLFGLLIGGALVLLAGAGAGYLAQLWSLSDFSQAYPHAQLSWAYFLVLAFGAIATAAMMMNTDRDPGAPSVALAYGLYIPLAVAGFGITSGALHLWPDALVVFSLHLAWTALLATLTLAVLGFRPLTLFGYTLGAALVLLGVILLIGLSGAGAVFGGQVALPTASPTPTYTITPTMTLTLTPQPPTRTPTLTQTVAPSQTPTETLTTTPTPMYALVRTDDQQGALLREEPGGTVIGSYLDGTLMQVLPGEIEEGGRVWVRVITPDGRNGWIVQTLLATATPAPNW
jgi:hypothetical protein